MTSSTFTVYFGLLLLVSLCYAAGRLHQWYLTTSDREMAFRDGYDTATKSLFSLATRTARLSFARARVSAPSPSEVTYIESARAARHRAEDREAITQADQPAMQSA